MKTKIIASFWQKCEVLSILLSDTLRSADTEQHKADCALLLAADCLLNYCQSPAADLELVHLAKPLLAAVRERMTENGGKGTGKGEGDSFAA